MSSSGNSHRFIGRVAAAPVLTRPNNKPVCKFTLIRNESRGTEESGEKRDERVVSIQFTSFNGLAETLAKHVMEGDQLVIGARVENNNFKKEGEEVFGYNWVVEDFDFGAPGKQKRAQLDTNRAAA